MLGLIFASPLLLLLVLFTLSNEQPVNLLLWPTDLVLQAPLSVAVLSASAVFFVLGGVVVGLGSLPPAPPGPPGGKPRARAGERGAGAEATPDHAGPAHDRGLTWPPAARVKICGINSPEAYEAAGSADWVGFVFFPPSPRFVTPARAAELTRLPGPPRVGLFVDPTDAAIADALAQVRLDVLQLVAAPERAAAIRRQFGLPVWRAVGIHSVDDLPTEAAGVDALLLDAKAPPDAALPGGNAQRFDWSVLRGWSAPTPWLLAAADAGQRRRGHRGDRRAGGGCQLRRGKQPRGEGPRR